MTDHVRAEVAPIPVKLTCVDLEAAIAFYVEEWAFRLDMIMPADAPRTAVLSGHGLTLRLDVGDRAADRTNAIPDTRRSFVINRANAADAWVSGRAGMQYRDLIPGRLGGRYIASHIRIPAGGPVPDYVHYHRVRFQMIYCKQGWVRVVYEDQGPPFVLQAGDCVLQPPTIRHRVLEASPGLEVIEIGAPAEHETFREHEIELPTTSLRLNRRFDGQRFVRHVAAQADWQAAAEAGFEFRDLGIASATDGLANVRVLRMCSVKGEQRLRPTRQVHAGDFLFWLVLEGRLELNSAILGRYVLAGGDACAIAGGSDHVLKASEPCEVLEVSLSHAE